ncbi:MAG: Rieske 2Fe-2S domain-containing protein [Alphaproteobacteria bacterium]|nr:Rieske 2Fe-2S domain-containing protein [Alphaproteobacteria bacterium]
MSAEQSQPSGPDLTQGVLLADLADGAMLLGHVGDDAVLLARRGQDVFAIGATCTHYGGPLAEGLLAGDTVRCPWHHACFNLRTGEALRAPALNPVPCWRVERQDGRIVVREKAAAAAKPEPLPAAGMPESIVILGGGAAGNSAAETLRREGYAGSIAMVSADSSGPYDRPNLSKDYLAGNAPEEWIPLRGPEFYRDHGIDLRLGARAAAIDTAQREVRFEDGSRCSYDALLIATGAEPVRLDLPGGDLPHVHYLRSLDDSRAIIERAKSARRAVVIGASFIGLEVAASLRARKVEVHVVAPEAIPMERIMGREIGELVRTMHEEHGVQFHLGTTVTSIGDTSVELKNGETLAADLVVVGVGVRPAVGLAEKAGLTIDRGVVVDKYLQTSAPGIFAAGDIARWPDPHTGDTIRVEHWVVAQRQGQAAARNMLGRREPFDAVPFFWSMHYDVPILYVGHAEKWDEAEIDGRVEDKDCRVTYRRAGRTLAVATIGRDAESLRAEVELERQLAGATTSAT